MRLMPFLWILIIASMAFANTAPTVTKVTASQRTDGSEVVDIWYTLADAENNPCTVTVLISNDGGSTFTIVPSSGALSGALANVYPGRRHITWASKVDLPGVFGSNYRIKVMAYDGPADILVPWRQVGPAINGILSPGEWPDGHIIQMDRIDGGGEHSSTVYFQHDSQCLYIGIQSGWGKGWDVYWQLNIDGDYSRSFSGNASSPYVDMSYSRQSPGGWSGYTQFRYFNSANPNGVPISVPSGFINSSAGSTDVFYEFKIPLSAIGAMAGDKVGFYVAHGYDGVSEHLYVYPTQQSNIESWITLTLGQP